MSSHSRRIRTVSSSKPRSIFLIRHGSTEWNASGRLNSTTDLPLNDLGKKQAKNLAAYLRHFKISRILVSPRTRAIETSQPIARVSRSQVIIDPRLREIDFGVFEGRTPHDILSSKDRRRCHPWSKGLAVRGHDGLESLRLAAKRAKDVFDEICEQTGNTILVTHGAFGRVLLATCVFGIPANRYRTLRLNNGGITEIVLLDNRNVLTKLNCYDHEPEKLVLEVQKSHSGDLT